MNRPTSNNHRDDDEEIRGWMVEAGDPRVEPRPEHVEQVRSLLLDRVGPERGHAKSRRRFQTARWLAAACLVIAVGLGIHSFLVRPVSAWASVAQALQEKVWIHVVTRSATGTSNESWISPRHEILAQKYDFGPELRGAEYLDLKAGVKTRFVAGENTIYRLPEGTALQEHDTRGLDFYRQLLRGEAFKASPVPHTKIVEQKIHEVVHGGKTWKEYEWTVRDHSEPHLQLHLVMRVDAQTGLPETLDIEAADGEKTRQAFDYPESGPADILALGVPTTAKRVDRVPGDDINRLLTGLKIGRNRFDDYCGYVSSSSAMDINRVWRKGRKWRVEAGYPRNPTRTSILEFAKVPENADLAWWKRHEKSLVFDVFAICDGQSIWYYRYKPQLLVPDQPYSSKLESVTAQPVYGSSDDPMMSSPHLLPEQIGHPDASLPDSEREFLIDAKPNDGPPNTVRLRVRNAQSSDPNRPDLYRLWVDTEKNYLAIKAESSVFDPTSPRKGSLIQSKIAYIDTKTVTDFGRSPSGFWYPTRVVRVTSNNDKYEQVTRFVLDFQAQIPDAIFEPVK